MNTIQDRDIYLVKLNEISTAALEAVGYINELVAELEVANEETRINELVSIKKSATDAVKKNEREVKLAMQQILEAAAPPPQEISPPKNFV